MNKPLDLKQIGFLLYMQEQEEKEKQEREQNKQKAEDKDNYGSSDTES